MGKLTTFQWPWLQVRKLLVITCHYQRVIHVFLISLHQSPQSAWLAPTRFFFSWELGIHVDLIPRNQTRQWKSPSWNSNHGFLVTGLGQGSIIVLFFCAPPPLKTRKER